MPSRSDSTVIIADILESLQFCFVKFTIWIQFKAGTLNWLMIFPPEFTVIVWVARVMFILIIYLKRLWYASGIVTFLFSCPALRYCRLAGF